MTKEWKGDYKEVQINAVQQQGRNVKQPNQWESERK
jgi:hypothetical protein